MWKTSIIDYMQSIDVFRGTYSNVKLIGTRFIYRQLIFQNNLLLSVYKKT